MKKYSFVVDVVGNGSDVAEILSDIQSAVKSHGEFRCVDHVETADLSDQGLKVWAKRKIGISLATPKAKKVKVEKQTETAAS
jgi:hypothetical protein